MKIERLEIKGCMDIEHLYLPFIITDDCKKCGIELKVNLQEEYLSFPSNGKSETINFYCKKCDWNHNKEIVLDINIKEYI